MAEQAGHAAIYLGGAGEYVDSHRADVDALVALLRSTGVDEGQMASLALVLHSYKEVPYRMGKRTGMYGWHIKGERIRLTDPETEEHRDFSHAVHVAVGDDNKANAHVLHEAGHLWAHAVGLSDGPLYTEHNKRKLRRAGGVLLAGIAAGETALTVGAVEGKVPVIAAGVFMVAGILGAAVGRWLVQTPEQPLHILSRSERYADHYAERHADVQIIAPSAFPLADNQFLVHPSNYSSILPVQAAPAEQ